MASLPKQMTRLLIFLNLLLFLFLSAFKVAFFNQSGQYNSWLKEGHSQLRSFVTDTQAPVDSDRSRDDGVDYDSPNDLSDSRGDYIIIDKLIANNLIKEEYTKQMLEGRAQGKSPKRIVSISYPRTLSVSPGPDCNYHDCTNIDCSTKFENEMGEYKEPSSDQDLPPLTRYGKVEECVQGRAWHSFVPLNCNAFHEIDSGMTQEGRDNGNYYQFLDGGGRRDAWTLYHSIPKQEQSERVVLKKLRWGKTRTGTKYDENTFDNQRKDALALERLSHSPHVIDVYGYCGMSTFNEFAGNGNLYRYLKYEKKDAKPKDLLVYARNISMGLADIQEVDKRYPDDDDASFPMPPGVPSLLQFDFRHHNMLLTKDNRIKVSDFNVAQLLRWNVTSHGICGYRWDKECGRGLWGLDRSPEECTDPKKRTQPLTSKTEVFHLGNILNFLLTNMQFPFISEDVHYSKELNTVTLEGDETAYNLPDAARKAQDMIVECTRPPLPAEILDSSDPAIRAMVKARNKSLICNAKERPSAREVATILDNAISPDEHPAITAGDRPPAMPQNDRGLHRLEFVHISKTGGTSIEVAGEI